MAIPFRIATGVLLLVAPLFPQGGGGVQFRDYKAPAPTSSPRTACASLVALTGYALPEDLRRAFDAGFSWHVAKPTTLEALERVLNEPLRGAPSERSTEQIATG